MLGPFSFLMHLSYVFLILFIFRRDPVHEIRDSNYGPILRHRNPFLRGALNQRMPILKFVSLHVLNAGGPREDWRKKIPRMDVPPSMYIEAIKLKHGRQYLISEII